MEKEKFVQHEDLRHQVEYSKSNRSSCKKCRSTIAMNAIRIGVETPSRVFDGYDVKWYHLSCVDFAKSKVFYINQLKHYELLRWDDQINIRAVLKQSDDNLDSSLKTYYDEVWRVKDIIGEQLKPAIIKKLFLENYPKLDSLSPNYNLHFLADGLVFGRNGPCPTCNGLTVLYDGKNYYCRGYTSSFSRCNWHGSSNKRYRWVLDKSVIPSSAKFFKDFHFSHIHPHENLDLESIVPLGSTSNWIDNEGNNEELIDSEPSAKTFLFKDNIKKDSVLLKVDPEFSKAKSGEIVVKNDEEYGDYAFNISMSYTDLVHNNNSFYILQLIKVRSTYWVYCRWGRIGTSSGGTMEHDHSSFASASKEFEERFEDKSGVKWSERANYKKQNGKYYLVDLEDNVSTDDYYDGSSSEPQPSFDTKPSKLPVAVQELVKTLFDSDLMKKQLSALQFDEKKMPLGKISQNQVKMAYKALTQIQDIIETDEKENPLKQSQLMEASSRFYTIIPHSFSSIGSKIPVINSTELLIKSMRLVDALSEIEVANNLRKLSQKASSGNSIDDNYSILNSKLEALSRESSLFKNVEDYLLSTTDPNIENLSNFEIQDIFSVERNGEEEQFKQWEFNQRMLLFHGSRITNWIGILSNGFRIAPPEAPKTGYRAGKGLYFADTINVSLGYCYPTKEYPVAVLSICDVALGSSLPIYQDTYMEEPMYGFNSTKAIGKKAPALFDSLRGSNSFEEESTIQVGPIIESSVITSFTHNEYVIYNKSQCRTKYLVLLKLK
ncbi:hypothetical protein DICPUDRAFT_41865 [Dictyostelium purpureum]|uniref:Poly [ADP-ribose] polymerase n=1 Tax=Dictyostelium purpureum TaxID=5786 RepID=F1A0Y8_DICPU|nr:uncharacterized protein DICPUDRAFT_41865 [Dictyostelium purpureum]EGC30151.1 hypothetical protein DICPUDRAFT_41865 [Dictyostelium purpureum]|eukprot:XP_003293334.1 hypothetical protein DICPUDRAFT_41865 [Dictyostelium purpureum]